MMREIVEAILSDGNKRSALSEMRAYIKSDESADREEWISLLGECKTTEEELLSSIVCAIGSEDAKTRKNAALLMGDYHARWGTPDGSEDVIWNAYRSEDTRFVKTSYIKALSRYDCSGYIGELKKELDSLCSMEVQNDELKHVRELRLEISRIIDSYESEERAGSLHPIDRKHVIVVEAEEYIQKNIARYISEELGDKTSIVDGGVKTVTNHVMEISRLPFYRHLWFVIRFKSGASRKDDMLAESLADSELLPLLTEAYGRLDRYTFKLEASEDMSARQAKTFSMQLEENTDYRLHNVIANPDILLRVRRRSESEYTVYGRLAGLGDDRFSYIKRNLPTSMSPVVAAQMAELIAPYTSADSQVIDPMCGTGALLIARCKGKAVRYAYGVDKYAQAIDIARENSKAAGFEPYYINRDFFDFKSEYLMDEVITEMPRMENVNREETDDFYKRFMDKAMEITGESSMIFMLSTEGNIIKKQIRLHRGLELVRQIAMRGHEQIYIIKRRS